MLAKINALPFYENTLDALLGEIVATYDSIGKAHKQLQLDGVAAVSGALTVKPNV